MVDHLHGRGKSHEAKRVATQELFALAMFQQQVQKGPVLSATRRGMSVAGEEGPVEMPSKQVECNDEPGGGHAGEMSL